MDNARITVMTFGVSFLTLATSNGVKYNGLDGWVVKLGTARRPRPLLAVLNNPTHQRPVYQSPLLCGFNEPITG